MRKSFCFLWIVCCFLFLVNVDNENNKKQVVVNNDVKLTNATELGFEDENFYACILESLEKEDDTLLLDEDLETVTVLECSNREIKNVVGVSKLVNLESLDLSRNQLSDIDISTNLLLTTLDVSDNNISTLDVSKNVRLVNLEAFSNNIGVLDVSNNVELIHLGLGENNLRSLEVSKNILLERLSVYNNELENLDISNNTKLTTLEIGYNNLEVLDVSKNLELGYLNVEKNNLRKLDLSNNKKVESLIINGNLFREVDLKNQKGLVNLKIDYDDGIKLDFSNYDKLEDLYLYDNDIIPVYHMILNSNGGYSFLVKDIEKYFPEEMVIQDYVVYSADTEDALLNEETEVLLDSSVKTMNKDNYFRVLGEISSVSGIDYSGDIRFEVDYEIRFVTISSDKYVIDEEKSIIDVGNDSDNFVKMYINSNWIGTSIDITNNKLVLSYNGKVLREFTLQRVIDNPSTGNLSIVIIFFVIIISIGSIVVTRKSIYNNRV